jgi:hypothetical protein
MADSIGPNFVHKGFERDFDQAYDIYLRARAKDSLSEALAALDKSIDYCNPLMLPQLTIKRRALLNSLKVRRNTERWQRFFTFRKTPKEISHV